MTKMPEPGDSRRPKVGVVFTRASGLSCEGEQLAKYVGLCMAASGQCESVAVVSLPSGSSRKEQQHQQPESDLAALRSDGLVIERRALGAKYSESADVETLRDCDAWILLTDAETPLTKLQALDKTKKKTKRVVLSLQSSIRQLQPLEKALVASTVLQGGVGFQVTTNAKGVLYPLSHGCYFVERLAADKVEALYMLDLLEGTGIQVLSRRNIPLLKWGYTMLRSFYYVNALTGQSVQQSLRDRPCRLLFLQALYEMWTLFGQVMASSASSSSSLGTVKTVKTSSEPDTIAATYLSIPVLMILLPLPNWLFNGVLLKLLDFGLTASETGRSSIQRDVEANLATDFWTEYKDVFELAKGRDLKLPALEFLKQTLATAADAKAGSPKLSGLSMLQNVIITPQSRLPSRNFFLKTVLTIVLTLALLTYLFVL